MVDFKSTLFLSRNEPAAGIFRTADIFYSGFNKAVTKKPLEKEAFN
jgi:hypothetical protein